LVTHCLFIHIDEKYPTFHNSLKMLKAVWHSEKI
jgi:hypothetical protein